MVKNRHLVVWTAEPLYLYILPNLPIELDDWTTTNQFAKLWFCEDIHHSPILKLAIKKAIQKSPNRNLSSKLFQDDSNNEKNQFVAFVSSHKKRHNVDILPYSQLCCLPY
jgi:hypothetical protein